MESIDKLVERLSRQGDSHQLAPDASEIIERLVGVVRDLNRELEEQRSWFQMEIDRIEHHASRMAQRVDDIDGRTVGSIRLG
jgi:hypothetical protein